MNVQNELQFCKSKVSLLSHLLTMQWYKIIKNKLQFLIVFQNLCFKKDLSGSDNDSALSSAPPSLSPQPGTQSNSPDVWQTVSQCFFFYKWNFLQMESSKVEEKRKKIQKKKSSTSLKKMEKSKKGNVMNVNVGGKNAHEVMWIVHYVVMTSLQFFIAVHKIRWSFFFLKILFEKRSTFDIYFVVLRQVQDCLFHCNDNLAHLINLR